MSETASILIVDDREENLLALEGWLENPDLNIVKATSGNQALGLMLEEDFALVLLDVQMPGMDGFEAAELMRLSEKTKNVPIIFVTAISKEQQQVFKGYKAGAVDYLYKPLDPDILKAKVNVFLQLYRQKRSLEDASEELKRAEEKYYKTFQSTHACVGLCRLRDGLITEANQAMLNLLGYDKEGLIGHTITTLGFWSNLADWEQQLQTLKSDGKAVNQEYWLRTRSGELRLCNHSAELIQIDNEPHIIFTFIDLTENKRAEEAIVVAKKDWESTFDSVTDMITIHDENFNIIRANPAAKEILALQSKEGIPFAKCFTSYHGTESPPPDCPSCQCIRTGMSSITEKFEPHLNKYIEVRAMPRFGSDGRLVGLIHVVRDITERKRAEEQLQHTLDRLRKAFGATIQVMASAVEARDPYTAGHQIRAANLARAIATEMELSYDKIEAVRVAGSIHDIGKLSLPAEILTKPTKLSALEFSLIKEHSARGFEMLKNVESPWPLAEIVFQHHERMDGSGYPRNLRGEEILMEARILTVADVVEAMASHRPYRPGLGIHAALDEIEKNRGVFYDSTVADACLTLFREKGFKLEGT